MSPALVPSVTYPDYGPVIAARVRLAADAAKRGVPVTFEIDAGDDLGWPKLVWWQPSGTVRKKRVIMTGSKRAMAEALLAVEEMFRQMVSGAL